MEKTVCIVILYGIVMLMACYNNIFPKKNKPKNNVHFYVARDKDGILWLYMCKPIRKTHSFFSCDHGKTLISSEKFSKYGLNIHDFDYLKWEDEPVEVFLNLED